MNSRLSRWVAAALLALAIITLGPSAGAQPAETIESAQPVEDVEGNTLVRYRVTFQVDGCKQDIAPGPVDVEIPIARELCPTSFVEQRMGEAYVFGWYTSLFFFNLVVDFIDALSDFRIGSALIDSVQQISDQLDVRLLGGLGLRTLIVTIAAAFILAYYSQSEQRAYNQIGTSILFAVLAVGAAGSAGELSEFFSEAGRVVSGEMLAAASGGGGTSPTMEELVVRPAWEQVQWGRTPTGACATAADRIIADTSIDPIQEMRDAGCDREADYASQMTYGRMSSIVWNGVVTLGAMSLLLGSYVATLLIGQVVIAFVCSTLVIWFTLAIAPPFRSAASGAMRLIGEQIAGMFIAAGIVALTSIALRAIMSADGINTSGKLVIATILPIGMLLQRSKIHNKVASMTVGGQAKARTRSRATSFIAGAAVSQGRSALRKQARPPKSRVRRAPVPRP